MREFLDYLPTYSDIFTQFIQDVCVCVCVKEREKKPALSLLWGQGEGQECNGVMSSQGTQFLAVVCSFSSTIKVVYG
jgi:hypothetical protein